MDFRRRSQYPRLRRSILALRCHENPTCSPSGRRAHSPLRSMHFGHSNADRLNLEHSSAILVSRTNCLLRVSFARVFSLAIKAFEMSGTGSGKSWSPFDSPFGHHRWSNEAAFDTTADSAFHPDSLGSEMGGSGTFPHMPREASGSFCDEAFPFPGRTSSNPSAQLSLSTPSLTLKRLLGDFGGFFGNDAGVFSFRPEERCTSPSFPDWDGLAGDFGTRDAFSTPIGGGGPSLGREPPPGFGYPRTDPFSTATPGGFSEGATGSFGAAFPGCGQGQRGPCTSGFLYEIENYVLFIQPTWAGWDFNNQPPLQKILEHLLSSLLLHYVANFNISVPGDERSTASDGCRNHRNRRGGAR